MERVENQGPLFVVKPKFNFIYELGMPTGRKMKSDIFALLIFLVVSYLIVNFGSGLQFANISITSNFTVKNLLDVVCYVLDIAIFIKLLVTIGLQIFQYKGMAFTFYPEYMIYEDTFLNQHKKNIQYANIKEVELRRTVWDRILGYGIIVIYTNAENEYNNGLVLYAIKHPKEEYIKIDKLVHKERYAPEFNEIIPEQTEARDTPSQEVKQLSSEEDFMDSLKHTKEE